MGDGLHRAFTETALTRVKKGEEEARVREALKRRCGRCGASPGLWCVVRSVAPGHLMVTEKLHLSRFGG